MTASVAALLAAAKRSLLFEHEENCRESITLSALNCPFCVGYRASALDAAIREVEANNSMEGK